MIIIHAVQKLLNISKLKPALFISEPSTLQDLHPWYAKLLSSTYRGKMLVMYVHQPSLFIIVTKGKTVTSTVNEFHVRLEAFLHRQGFDTDFIKKEMRLVKEGYIISKTNSRSMLGSMNAIGENVEHMCYTFRSYEAIDFDYIEDSFMDWLVTDKTRPYYFRRTSDYWKEKGLI